MLRCAVWCTLYANHGQTLSDKNSQREPPAAAPPSPLLAVPNVIAHPSTASVPTSYYSMWHYMNAVAARPLMLSPCLATSPTDAHYNVTSHRHPVTSPLHSPTSMTGVAVVGDGGHGLLSPVNSSSGSSARPWPTSPTDHRGGTWVRGSAESLVGQVRQNLPSSLSSSRKLLVIKYGAVKI